ncbi:MAG: hypothetical protein AB8G05_09110 [Oligoflexales bacterium]
MDRKKGVIISVMHAMVNTDTKTTRFLYPRVPKGTNKAEIDEYVSSKKYQ